MIFERYGSLKKNVIKINNFYLFNKCSINPTSAHACKFRVLFFKMAVNTDQTSACKLGEHMSNSSNIWMMFFDSKMTKFSSKSNSPPTNCKENEKKVLLLLFFKNCICKND